MDEVQEALAVYDKAFDVSSRALPTMLDVETYLTGLAGRLATGPTFACWRRRRCRCPSPDDCDCSDVLEVPVLLGSATVGSNCAYVLDLRPTRSLGSGSRLLDKMVLRLFSISEDGYEVPLLDITRRSATVHLDPPYVFRILDVHLVDTSLVVRFDYMSFVRLKDRGTN